jgi:hypothetical protein
MAARNFVQHQYSLQPDIVTLYGVFTGGTGALTKVAGHGIASCTQSGTGVHTIVLTDKYAALIGATVTLVDPTPSGSADKDAHVTSYSMSTKTVVIQMTTDVPSDGQLMLSLTLVNSARPIK